MPRGLDGKEQHLLQEAGEIELLASHETMPWDRGTFGGQFGGLTNSGSTWVG